MSSSGFAGDIFDTLSIKRLSQLKECVLKLYKFNLENAKEVFNQVLIDIENDLGSASVIVEKLTKKMLFDLKSYVSPEDASWFIKRRLERVGPGNFGTLAICDCLSKCDEEFENIHATLLETAKKDDNVIKLLLANVLMAVGLSKNKSQMQSAYSSLRDINLLLKRVEKEYSAARGTELDNHYMCWAFCDLAFLFRNFGDEWNRIEYFKKSIDINEQFGRDLGLSICTETFLLRAIATQKELQEEMESLREHLLEKVQLALNNMEDFETIYGVKILREAFLEASRICHAKRIDNETVIKVGKMVYNSLEGQFGETHHEVVVTASQMAYHFYTFDEDVHSELFFELANEGIKSMGEDSKVLLDMKGRSISNLCKLLRRRRCLEEAERYCKEEIRLKKLELGENNQYVAQMLRILAFIVRDQGRTQEGLRYMQESLQMSQDFCPTFKNYHVMVRKEIRVFGARRGNTGFERGCIEPLDEYANVGF